MTLEVEILGVSIIDRNKLNYVRFLIIKMWDFDGAT